MIVARSTPRRNSCIHVVDATSKTRSIVPLTLAVTSLFPAAVRASPRSALSCASINCKAREETIYGIYTRKPQPKHFKLDVDFIERKFAMVE